MSARELIALGTGSQVPTRRRNHNGYLLRWDDEGFLFDPGEGTQRQLAFGDLAVSSIHRVCVTHFHGDHCLGLAGIVQRLSLDRCAHPVHVHFPASGAVYFERLRYASIYHAASELVPEPVQDSATGMLLVAETDTYRLLAHRLEHGVPTVGYRLEEKSGRTFLPARLAEAGIKGPLVAELARKGRVAVGDREVTLEEVSLPKPGMVFAFVMDTRPCAGALELARGADLLVMEATYTAEDQLLAQEHGHCSATDAARTALEAGARRLALTHFSQRYLDPEQHLRDARALFPETVALTDLGRVELPRRRPMEATSAT